MMPWYELTVQFKAIDDKDASLVIDPAVRAVKDVAIVDGVTLRELSDE